MDLKNLKNKDYLVTNDVNGNVFAVVKEGEKLEDRIIQSIKEEFDFEEVSIKDVVDDMNGVTFSVISDDEDIQLIRLLTAFIY